MTALAQSLSRTAAHPQALRAYGLLLGVLSVAGALIAAASFVDGFGRDGGAAYDFSAYYAAGQRYLTGQPLYTPMEINDPGAYRYLPTFAALMAPLSVLPELPLTWLYRLGCLLCVRYLVGSWRATGISLLFPPVLIELWALNLTLPLAAGARFALRGSGAAYIPAQAPLKYGAALLLPYLWLRRAPVRRPLLIGLAATIIVISLHVALDPAAWAAFVDSLLQQAASVNDAPYVGDQLLFVVPSTSGDFALRVAIAIALTGLAVRLRSDTLAFAATIIAVPTLWLARLAPLVALPRMWREDRAAPAEHRAG